MFIRGYRLIEFEYLAEFQLASPRSWHLYLCPVLVDPALLTEMSFELPILKSQRRDRPFSWLIKAAFTPT